MKILLFTTALILLALPADSLHGQHSEDFTLEAVTGERDFVLSSHRGAYVALHFLLKTQCPVCIRHTWDYSEKAGRLPGVIQVFIKPDSEEEIGTWTGNLPEAGGLSFPIYRDPEAQLAKAFRIPYGYRFHGEVVHYPALVLLGPDGKEVFRYVGENNSDRFSFEQLEKKIGKLEN